MVSAKRRSKSFLFSTFCTKTASLKVLLNSYQISKLRKEFPKGGYIYKTGKKSSASVHVGEEHKSSVSTVDIVLGVITFLICLWQKIDIRVMVFSIALSVVMPSTIRTERAKRRITLLGVMATIVLIINFIFLGLILFLRYFT